VENNKENKQQQLSPFHGKRHSKKQLVDHLENLYENYSAAQDLQLCSSSSFILAPNNGDNV
jgi:hypothetical protein